jgi:hypothetical protein
MHFQKNLPPPKTDMLRSYRAACLAYRAVMQQGGGDREGTTAAVAALQKLHPGWTCLQAVRLAERAVAYAATNHAAWFWKGRCG